MATADDSPDLDTDPAAGNVVIEAGHLPGDHAQTHILPGQNQIETFLIADAFVVYSIGNYLQTTDRKSVV